MPTATSAKRRRTPASEKEVNRLVWLIDRAEHRAPMDDEGDTLLSSADEDLVDVRRQLGIGRRFAA